MFLYAVQLCAEYFQPWCVPCITHSRSKYRQKSSEDGMWLPMSRGNIFLFIFSLHVVTHAIVSPYGMHLPMYNFVYGVTIRAYQLENKIHLGQKTTILRRSPWEISLATNQASRMRLSPSNKSIRRGPLCVYASEKITYACWYYVIHVSVPWIMETPK